MPAADVHWTNVPCRQVHAYGWASVFYIFGSMGVVWFVLWLRKAASGPVNDTRVSEKEREYIIANTCEQVRACLGDGGRDETNVRMPV